MTKHHLVLLFLVQLTLTQGQGPGLESASRVADQRVKFTVQENVDLNTLIGTIPTLQGYTYRFNEDPEILKLDSVTGELRSNGTLDRESLVNDRINVLILSSTPVYPVEVEILVTDLNDNEPKFPKSEISLIFPESAAVGTQVILATATDADLKENGTVRKYAIVSGNLGNSFKVTLSTNLSEPLLFIENRKRLNREVLDSYSLNISAQDDGAPPKTGYMKIDIQILDSNDNPPIFDQSEYSALINESAPIGTSVVRVRATDQDLDGNAEISYSVADDTIQFDIDSSGVLTTLKRLECQKNCPDPFSPCTVPRSCVVTVEATDKGNPPLTGRAYINVRIRDENDHSPVIAFQSTSSREFVGVDESAPSNYLVVIVTVTDEDDGLNGQTILKIVAGNELNHFRLESLSERFNYIKVNGVLDREKIPVYNLTLQASDKGTPSLTSTQHLIIYVNDVNDHAPVFVSALYSASLTETLPVGSYVSSVTAIDEDSGVNALVTYRITGGDANNWFKINSETGLVTTAKLLNRELHQTLTLNISAEDSGSRPYTSYTTLQISISDENNHVPTFSQLEYLITKAENLQANSELMVLNAKDGDSGLNGSVLYSLVPEVEHLYPSMFAVDRQSGRLTTRQRLDREVQDFYTIGVKAEDQGNPPKFSFAKVLLNVTDLNDNFPVVEPQAYYAVVKESDKAGTVVAEIKATDKDVGENARTTFVLENENDRFRVDEKGIVRTKVKLMRSMGASYTMSIKAMDSNTQRFGQKATVFVKITDQNTIFPRFTLAEYGCEINEDGEEVQLGRRVCQVRATTQDITSSLKYRIVGGNVGDVFAIDNGGVLTNKKRIDREEMDVFDLTILADAGSAYDFAKVKVKVGDLNDNPPKFDDVLVRTEIAENSPIGHEVYRAMAKDPDSGPDSKIAYSLSQDYDNVFEIDAVTGLIRTAKPLYLESKRFYDLIITAQDGGTPSKSAILQLHLTVADTNDHTPIFSNNRYEIVIEESKPVNDRFFALKAEDSDSGPNGHVLYAIVAGNDDKMFGIFPDGNLYIAQELDREIQDEYKLYIRASDQGINQRTASVNISIQVLDSNDNQPKFANESYQFEMYENTPPGFELGEVFATDKDQGRNKEITYHLENEDLPFKIDPVSGIIETKSSFDREELLSQTGVSAVKFTVLAIDNGIEPLEDEVEVTVSILDVNDQSPVFQSEKYEATVNENERIDSKVVRVSATDRDEGVNGYLTYYIVEGDAENQFRIDVASGEIFLNGRLDRETQDKFVLSVEARDTPKDPKFMLNSRCKVEITVSDYNDNEPIFGQTTAYVNLPEDTKPGKLLTQFQATDIDLRASSVISYEIMSGNEEKTFNLDSITGRMYLGKEVDFERKSAFTMMIKAVDHGTPKLSSTVRFVVNIQDTNDNSPVFPVGPIGRQIRENLPPNSPVVQVRATDADSDVNGKIVYSLVQQLPIPDMFSIEPVTGWIRTKKDIDRERMDSYVLKVMATDQAEPESTRKTAEKMVNVIVEDANDSTPKFVSMNAMVIPNDARSGSKIGEVKALDLDTGPNAEIRYEVLSGNTEQFSVNYQTGEIYLRKDLDPNLKTYSLKIMAKDNPTTGESNNMIMDLDLFRSGSANGLTFANIPEKNEIEENEVAGTYIATVNAAYSDGRSGRIRYYLTGIEAVDGRVQPRYFQIGLESGRLESAEELDRDSSPGEYRIQVWAVDMDAGGMVAAKAEIQVSLLDLNDNAPVFNPPSYDMEVPEDASVGRTVAIVSATDVDQGARVTFDVHAGNDGAFVMNRETGVLTTVKNLDREKRSSYNLTIRASDGKHESFAKVNIAVQDVNDHSPEFSQSAYSFTVRENVPAGTTVARVSAQDPDWAANGQIRYTMWNSYGSAEFNLDPVTGMFTTKGKKLDYERTPHYVITVKASDAGSPPRSATVTVYMNVADVNDNVPTFDPATYAAAVTENVTVGTSIVRVAATDQDSGLNGRVVYSIVDGDPHSQFSVDAQSGVIRTLKTLDREQKAFYTLSVRAMDLAAEAKDRLYSTAQVTVSLQDVNDNPPRFTSPNFTEVIENSPLNTAVFQVQASDPDAERNSYITYSLVSVEDEVFTLGPVDGKLRVNGRLDRETKNIYFVEVKATDQGSPSLSYQMRIQVNITDDNDNDPVFVTDRLEQFVAEDAEIGLSLIQVHATDEDLGLNAAIRFYVIEGDPNRDFKMDEYSGELRVNKHLDHERQSQYELKIQAEDSGRVKRFDTARVTVKILDVNDSPPRFVDSPYTAFVQENMDVQAPVHVLKVSARDDDSPENSRLTYAIRRGDKSVFSISSTSGLITANRPLDREEKNSYELVIVAHDSGLRRRSGTGTVHVHIQDVNDHSPVFGRALYTAYVLENEPMYTRLTQVSASDEDEGTNAQIRYSLRDSMGGRFTVDPASGQIVSLQVLDREQRDSYQLQVIASDSGSIPRSASADVLVHVEDANDHSPRFMQSTYNGLIADPTDSGDFVIGVTAADQDVGSNGKIAYTLSGRDAQRFSIGSSSGVIVARERLSGVGNAYQMVVTAMDQGTPARSTSVMVAVTVKSQATPPMISPGQRMFRISESEETEYIVTTLSAISSRGNIKYSITGGNVGDVFQIDEISGVLKMAKKLDYEIAKKYDLWCSAVDSGKGRSYVKVEIVVLDENDNVPRFDRFVYETAIQEGVPFGSKVVQITATDADSTTNAEMLFALNSGNQNGAFRINARNGQITTNANLDREKIDSYELIVSATDQGMKKQNTATATVKITVEDKNDNPPKFTRLFNVDIAEDAKVGAFVVQITSSDDDLGENAIAKYSFSGTHDNAFAIDELSGNVTVAAALDRETKDQYTLQVDANDGSWKIGTLLTIRISDANDHKPVFQSGEYEFDFVELQNSGTKVGEVTAEDDDADGPNSRITYSLKQDHPNFRIDPTTGEIFSKNQLKFAFTQAGPSPSNEHELVVMATDGGVPSQASEAVVMVTVKDANNHAPVFDEKAYRSAVAENAAPGVSVIKLTASDKRDYGENAKIRYTKTGGDGAALFHVNSQSGWITVSGNLGGRKGSNFTVEVTASDNGTPQRASMAKVYLFVNGINRHSPRFVSTVFQVTVPENKPVGSDVTRMIAADDDEGMNGEIRYAIVDGNEKGLFAMDEIQGRLTVAKALDFDTEEVHKLNIAARDRGMLYKESTIVFTVYLSDVNDNEPKFEKDVFEAYLPENSVLGTQVFNANATDIDSGSNAVIEYAIIGDSEARTMFTIEPRTGVVKTTVAKSNFDYEEKTRYKLVILARNPGTVLESTVEVNVNVESVNEFIPRFVQSAYSFAVSESATSGSSVGRVFATDEDKGEDGIVYYYLMGESNQKGFKVDAKSGEIFVQTPPDREANDKIMLTLLVKNRGPLQGNDTDQCLVTMVIQDANDAPVFSNKVYDAAVKENEGSDSSVVKVKATDADLLPEHQKFRYVILAGNGENKFTIDAQGLIKTTGSLDRERVPTYNITVGAIDTGNPPATGSATVRVNVLDKNDNGPIFVPEIPVGTVNENANAGTSVMTLTSVTSDPDVGENQGPYMYEMGQSPNARLFSVEPTTGILRTKAVLNREAVDSYVVPIVVSDAGTPTMTSTLDVKVKVADVNDNPSRSRSLEILVYSFQGHPTSGIADVKPLDEDTTGDYRCTKVRGSSKFSVESDCQLSGGALRENGRFELTVKGSDGVHTEVESEVVVEVSTMTNATLDNTIIIEIGPMTAEKFLSQVYNDFLSTLNNFFVQGSKIYIYHLEPKGQNLLVFMAVKKQNGGYHYQSILETQFNANKNVIGQQTGVTLVSANHNPCNDNPCQNSAECRKRVQLYEDASVTDSTRRIVTSPKTNSGFLCVCQQGFYGKFCNISVDSCGTNPCKNGAKCHTISGGTSYTCECPPQWRGQFCDQDFDECEESPCRNGALCTNSFGSYQCSCRNGFSGKNCENKIDFCRTSPCLNDGVCQSLATGYKCDCTFGTSGLHCEHTSMGFPSLSYLEFSHLHQTDNTITLEFSTVQSNALLLYNPGPKGKDYLALEIVGGRIRLSYALGDDRTTEVVVQKVVNDGQWHRVDVVRQGSFGQVKVGDCPLGKARCDPCLQASCQASASSATFSSLDVSGYPLCLGGVSSLSTVLERLDQVRSYDFTGCMRNVSVDGRRLLGETPIQSSGVTDTCPRAKQGACRADTCGAGTCIDEWGVARCECPKGMMPPDCKSKPKPFAFGAGARVEFIPKTKYLRDKQFAAAQSQRRKKRSLQTETKISFQIRTVEQNGLLFYSRSNDGETKVVVVKGRVRYESNYRGKVARAAVEKVNVATGRWWNVTLARIGSSSISLTVQDDTVTEVYVSAVHDFLADDVLAMSIGGTEQGTTYHGEDVPAFDGCLHEFKINGDLQPFTGATARFDVKAIGSITKTCPGPTLCDSTACGTGQTCQDDQGKVICVAQEPGLGIGLILVIVFFVVLLIAIVISVVILRFRKRKKTKKPDNGVGSDLSLVMGTNKANNLSGSTNPSYQDSGFNENAAMTDDYIRRHIQNELATFKYNEREVAPRPDILEPDFLNMSGHSVPDGEIIMENIMDRRFNGYHDVEHYDLDNASSIAPSDIDIVKHYKNYRKNGHPYYPSHGYPTHQQHETLRENSLSPTSLNRQSPNVLIDAQALQKMQSTPVRQSPMSFASSRPSPLTVPPIARQSPLSMNQLSRPRSGPSPMSTPSPLPQLNMMPNGGHHTHMPVPINNDQQRRPRRKKQRGLTVEEINRLNARHRPGDYMDGVSSGRPDLYNTGPSTLLEPPDSSSDEHSDNSFTCSEFEYENEKVRNDIHHFPKVPEEEESAPESNRTYSDSHSRRSGSISTFFPSDDEIMPRRHKPNGMSWDYLLNWGPNFEKLVGVFEDIAELPDTEIVLSPSARSTPSTCSLAKNQRYSRPPSSVNSPRSNSAEPPVMPVPQMASSPKSPVRSPTPLSPIRSPTKPPSRPPSRPPVAPKPPVRPSPLPDIMTSEEYV